MKMKLTAAVRGSRRCNRAGMLIQFPDCADLFTINLTQSTHGIPARLGTLSIATNSCDMLKIDFRPPGYGRTAIPLAADHTRRFHISFDRRTVQRVAFDHANHGGRSARPGH